MVLPGIIAEYLNQRFAIKSVETVGGGCINDCYQLKTPEGPFFLKINNADKFPGMFETEAKGLQLLAQAGSLRVPRVIETGQVNKLSFLLTEWVDGGPATKNSMRHFGLQLAQLHRHSAAQFGLGYDNYIGSLPQLNERRDAWHQFFAEMRIQPLLKLSRDKHLINERLLAGFEKLLYKLPELFPVEVPALLHGDLWSGNYMIDTTGKACIVDPAAYFGHREMDIAMTRLFGSFDPLFYEGYNEGYALESSWKARIDLCNLYPLLVHLNLFGSSYLSQLMFCVKRYV